MEPYPYRIFISYSQDDLDSVERVIEILTEVGLKPTWDKDIPVGGDFRGAIRNLISQSHLFLPFWTKNSKESQWFHEETAYALALNIPVLPLAVGALPEVMTENLQAINIKENLSDLKSQLKKVDFEQVVQSYLQMPGKMIEMARFPEERTKTMVEDIERIKKFGEQTWDKRGKSPWMIRQRAALSSFSIPKKDIKDDKIWKEYDGDRPRGDYYHSLVREEREGLEDLSKLYGLRLIISEKDPKERGEEATIVRLKELKSFLEDMKDKKVKIVISEEEIESNLTIVGNWFFAESRFPEIGGYHYTTFNRHAHEVLRKIDEFDVIFEELYIKYGKSRKVAIDILNERISKLKDELEKKNKEKAK